MESNFDMKHLAEKSILKRPNKYSTELYVDVLDRETIRVQFRNLSLWFNDADFLEFISLLRKAEKRLRELRLKQLSTIPIKIIPLAEIDYCDEGHDEIPDKKHQDGIDKLKELIKAGKRITPILVREERNGDKIYKRLDGYKRFKAFQELKAKSIECYINNSASFGGQTGVPWLFYDVDEIDVYDGLPSISEGVK